VVGVDHVGTAINEAVLREELVALMPAFRSGFA